MMLSDHRCSKHMSLGSRGAALPLLASIFTVLTACSLTPSGYDQELAVSEKASAQYDVEFSKRVLPEIPSQPTFKDILHRAFLTNGDLEAAYFEWREALANVRAESAYPNTNLMLGYSYLFSSENMKSFDRSSFDLGFDPMINLSFPTKVIKAGEVALEEAKAKGVALTAKKFAIQEEVLSNWAEYEGLSKKLQLAEEKVSVLELLDSSVTAEVIGGQSQKESFIVSLEVSRAKNELETIRAKLRAQRAMLNGTLALESNFSLNVPKEIELRPLTVDDVTVLKASVANNPELLGLTHEAEAKRYSLELARQQWIPDFNPTAMFTGTLEQSLGVGVVLPTAVAKIRAEVSKAEATLNGNLAALRQAKLERGASLIATLLLLRDLERQLAVYNSTLLPIANQLSNSVSASYSAGVTKLTDLIEAHLNVLEVKDALIEAQVETAKSLAKLEALMGVDIEALGPAKTPSLGALL